MLFQGFLFFVLCTLQSYALIVSSPRTFMDVFKPAITDADVSVHVPVSVRIRSTRMEDIEQISSLLASAAADGTNDGQFNFAASIAKMKRSASFHSLLLHRYQTMREGYIALSKVNNLCLGKQVSEADRMRLIWDHDSFRSKVQKAATMSNEPHAWKEHNFSLCPQDPSQLQHIMLTAEDSLSGSVLGFCEVAMMSSPEDETSCKPTIANLATCLQYRRRGIASNLLSTVVRYVKQQWDSSDEIALYVSKDNENAISLYKKHGFVRQTSVEDANVYMILKTRIRR
jgi:ribosomal protein S18 acetylase RimI-like enzyme